MERKCVNGRRVMLLLMAWMMLGCGYALSQKMTPAQKAANAKRAKELFETTFKKVYGEEGSRLTYSVNIIGVFKTSGTIYYKNGKERYDEKKITVWNDGKQYVRLNKPKETIEIYASDDPERNSHSGAMKLNPDNYDYELETEDGEYKIELEAKKNVDGIKRLMLALDQKSLVPKYLKLRFGIFSIKVQLSNIKFGDINDSLFDFPAEKYKGMKKIDHRTQNQKRK